LLDAVLKPLQRRKEFEAKRLGGRQGVRTPKSTRSPFARGLFFGGRRASRRGSGSALRLSV
jgi:hypothetical protein